MFCDLRHSTEILNNFEEGLYRRTADSQGKSFTYEEFILDLHETSYKELYLGHESTYAEIYGDGVMGIFPEDNTKYILENVYSLQRRVRSYNDSEGVGVFRPRIDIGFGITIGEVSFVHYPMDGNRHPVGRCVHEAARIQDAAKLYDTRILISERFVNFSENYIRADHRFSYRFIDRVVLKGFRSPLTLFELLLDNDRRFHEKQASADLYHKAYSEYIRRQWKPARADFLTICQEYGLGAGSVMAERCDYLSKNPPSPSWNGVWHMSDSS